MNGVAISRSFLPRSACRHAVQTIPSPVAMRRGSRCGRWGRRPKATQPADCPHWSDFHCPRQTVRSGCDTNEYCQILGCPSIRREFYLTWFPMIRPILLRRPPQSNYPPDAVPDPDYGPRLESRHEKGGISRLTPHWLAPMLQSLPPILHKQYQNSTSSCSKGPRGLSVLMQLTSIFTRTSISPGLWLRQ